MSKEQKFLLLAVLIVAGVGVTYYVTQNNSGSTTNQPTVTSSQATKNHTKQTFHTKYQTTRLKQFM